MHVLGGRGAFVRHPAARSARQVVCSSCSSVSSSYESFVDLPLELKRAPSVDAALRQFTLAEKLTGENKYRCPQCRSLVEAIRDDWRPEAAPSRRS